MKHLLTFTLLLFFAGSSYAQDSSTVYLNILGKEASKETARYYRKKIQQGSQWLVTQYTISGEMIMKGVYADDSCHIANGEFSWYKNKNLLYHSCHYTNGKANGADIYYYDNGRKQQEGNYINDKKDGEWVGYFESGKISGKATYKDDKQLTGQFFNEDGSNNQAIRVFLRPAEYPGAGKALMQYLSSSISYPRKAQKKEIEGTVVVQFIVRANGTISDIGIDQSVEPSLDAEALRVIKSMPDWTPAIIGGRYSDSYMKQPITFRLK